MSDWSAGYVADIGYTHGYYTELNPLRVQLAFAQAGLAAPSAMDAACELGFGQGVSVNVHAAASLTPWHGTDFNPAQVAFAHELAAASGAPVHLADDAFADFARQPDLPGFDYIGLHGIWSWISDENRAVIVDFVRRKLKVGGVLYISYNTLPGWASFAPMRHLMAQHAEVLGAEGRGIVSRVDGAIDFAERLLQTHPAFARANPQVAGRVEAIKGQSRQYLAHEYFNRDWLPMHFATMAQWLEPAKLQFGCSAHFLDHVNAINLSAQQQAFLKEIPDEQFRQSVRDFMVNQQFRKDYWVKGARRLSVLQQAQALRQLRVVLTTPRSLVPMKVQGALGEASLTEAIYGPVLEALADHKPRTLAQVDAVVQTKGVAFANLQEAVLVLSGAGHLALAQDDGLTAKARKQTDSLNAHLLGLARGSNDISYLSSPVTGGAVTANRFEQLFLLARAQGRKQPADWAQGAWQVLQLTGQRLVKDGKPLDAEADNLAELTRQAQAFADVRLPVLRALQVV